jgi:hypothetical protein
MNGHPSATNPSGQPGKSMPGMDMTVINAPASGGSPAWFAPVNWLGAVTFAIAAAFWTYGYVIDRQHATTRLRSLGKPAQAMMAAGMAILFLASLFEI